MALALILLGPLLGAMVLALVGWRPWSAWVAVGTNGAVLVAGILLSIRVVSGGAVNGAWGILRADALSAFMVILIGAISTLASWIGVRSLTVDLTQGHCTQKRTTLYGLLVQVFVTTMLLSVLASNLGVLWVGIEATTIATTFLVGHRRTRGSLEASWKYIIICSVGIALAFLGTVLVHLAAIHGGGHSAQALDWVSLVADSRHLDPSVLRVAFALIVLGYGTKAGLAPMHSWLPDAHGQAPAPISALMSGVLLAVAFYAILRFKAICDLAVGPSFSRNLLIVVALLSLLLAASLLLSQKDYKRMFAYSSIEHMGLIALGAAAGIPLAIAAVLLHILGHGLTKSVLFLASGEIATAEGSSRIDDTRALLARRPALAGIFGIGLLSLLGFPPFSLFASELAMIRSEFQVGLGWAAVLSMMAMIVIFIAIAGHARRMLFGRSEDEATEPSLPKATVAPLAGGLCACVALGILSWPFSALLSAAAHVVAR